MRKTLQKLAGAAVGGALMLVAANYAEAQSLVPLPVVARTYSAWLVRAYDQCSPGGLTITSPGLPQQGCFTSATVVDNLMPMEFGKIRITKGTGKIKLFGRGLTPGGRVKVLLTLRVTKELVATKHPPKSNARVTFADQTVMCGPPPFGFVIVYPTGVLGASMNLSDCLAPYTALASGNIEIVDVALLNADNSNRVFARPGILR